MEARVEVVLGARLGVWLAAELDTGLVFWLVSWL